MKTFDTPKIPTEKLDKLISNPSDNYLAIKKKLEEIDFESRVLKLYDFLITDTDELNKSTNDLAQKSNEIVSTKKRFFIETLDENATISNIISHNNEIVGCFKKTFDKINERMAGTLDVIQLLVKLENDIYALIEEQNISSNDLMIALNEISENRELSNSHVDALLEMSLERGFILRNRINILKDEIAAFNNRLLSLEYSKDEIDQIKNDISKIQSNITITQEQTIPQHITVLKNELNKETEEKLSEYIKKEVVYTQTEINDLLCKKCISLWIVYGVTTIILLTGLIASFLI